MVTAPMSKVTRPVITDVFPRKRLFNLLDQKRRQPVIWVCGPAGCGKTTFVSSYIDARNLPCLWYQIDEGDADPATFFYYLGQAAKKAAPRIRRPLPLLTPEYLQGISAFTFRYFEKLYDRLTPRHPPLAKGGMRGALASGKIRKDLHVYPPLKKGGRGGFILVFDNYQEVPSSASFHEVILNGLSRIPENVNVIIISRSEPPPAFIQLQANSLMGVLGWNELRLTQEESSAIIRLRSKQKVPKETIQHLHNTVDGWAAGLVLMLQSVKRSIDSRHLGKLTPEEIFDYLGTVLFDKAGEEIRDFLLKTAFLPRMTSRMAEELTDISHSGRILSTLSKSNYFTEKRFDKEPSYQYHRLFRDFLLNRARGSFSPETLSMLQSRAALLLEEAEEIEAAALLFRDANHWDGLIRLILKHAPLMVSQGRYRPLEEWLETLPIEVLENTPWLLYWMGECKLRFNPSQSRPCFEKAFDKFRSEENGAGTFLAWSGVINSIWLDFSDFKQFDKWISIFEELIHDFEEFPSKEIDARVASSMFIALAMRQPLHPEIEKWSERTFSSLDYHTDTSAKSGALVNQITYRNFTGDFEKMALPITLLRQWGKSRDASPTAQIIAKLAETWYYRITGFHEKCLSLINEGLELARTSGIYFMDYVFLTHGIMSALSKNDTATVENFLEKMESYLSRLHPWGKFFYHYLRTREALLRGDIKQASFHSELSLKFGTDAGCHLTLWMCHVMKAHVMHRLGKDREARDHLSHVSRRKLGEYVVLMAEALFALDRGEEASGLASLRKALAIGKEGKYLDPYVDQPSAMAMLCEKALEAGIEVEYVQELIRRRNLIPEKLPIHLEHWPWPLKVFTLGRFEILRDGQPLQFTRKVQQKPLSLLKALIAFGGRKVREEQIADLLWSESDGDIAHQSFEIALHRLRQLIGHPEAIQLREGCLTLDPKYCWIDVWAFEGLVEKVDATWREERKGMDMAESTQLIQKTLDIYQGSFLPEETFEPWTDSLRERLRNKFLRCVEKLGHYWENSGQWEKAVEYYQRGLEIDELIEEFYQHLMVSYQKLDQPTKALSVYNRCKKTLSSALGIEPSLKTQTLYKSLIANWRNGETVSR